MLRLAGRAQTGVLIAGLAILAACSDSGNEPGVTPPPAEQLRVTLSKQADTLTASDVRTYSATVTNLAGVPQAAVIDWSTTDPTVLTVRAGEVTAVAPGQAALIARAGTVADTATILVIPAIVEVRLNPSAVAASLGDTIIFEATLVGADGSYTSLANVVWTVSDTNAAAVVDAGMIETRAEGEIMVHAQAGSMSAAAPILISRAHVHSVTLSPANLTLSVGAQATFTAIVRDDRGRRINNREVAWNSSNPAVAGVSSDGEVSAFARGGAVITAQVDGRTASAAVNVVSTPAASVSLNLPSDSIVRSGTMQATATPRDAGGNPVNGRPVAWQSSNPAVATVTSSGLIRGLVAGQTTISVICDGHVTSRRVTVVVGQATSIQITPASATISLGSSADLQAEVLDQLGGAMGGYVASWASLSPGVVSVANDGTITGLAAGSGSVRATYGSLSATASITVENVGVAALIISPDLVTLQAGEQTTFIATLLDQSGLPLSNRPVSWRSLNPSVATIGAGGQVTALAAGTALVTATSQNEADTASVTVEPPSSGVVSITLVLNSPSLSVGQSTQAVARAWDGSGAEVTGLPVAFSSQDPQLATITSSGLVAGVSPGSATVSATIGGETAYATVAIAGTTSSVQSITFTAPTTQIVVGDSVQTQVVLRDASGNVLNRTVSYSTNRSNIAKVSVTGLVRSYTTGDASITASSGGLSKSIMFEVFATPPAPVPVATVSVTLNSASMTVGNGTQATAVLRDQNGNTLAGRSVTWSSSNSAVASVSPSGYVTAVAAGTASIVALSEGKTGAAAVTVQGTTQPPPGQVATVQVTFSANDVTVGTVVTATATARDQSGAVITGRPVTWTSGTASVATIAPSTTATATVTTLVAGQSSITAVVDGVSGSRNIFVLGILPPPPPPTPVTPPVLPQIINFTYPSVTGKQWIVKPTDNLQTILNQAQRGDEVVLPAGATFTGNFTLPAKTGTAANGWIIIRSDKSAQLPPQGTRVTKNHANLMPKLMSHNVGPALQTALNAKGWWISGVQMTVSPAVTAVHYGVVKLGIGGLPQDELSEVASDLVLDRVYINVPPTMSVQRCLELQSARTAVMDSYLVECHGKGFDSQAIVGWNGPGPFKIVNNTLAGAGENIMFGGADPKIPGLIPSDIEIRRNYIYTPPSWKGVWTKKNLFETKNAARILIEENIFDGSWADAQVGYAFVLKVSNQSGACTWCTTRDITIRRNIIRNAGGAFDVSGNSGSNNNTIGARLSGLLIEDNVVENINVSPYNGEGRFVGLFNNSSNVIIRGNTMTGSNLKQFMCIGTSPAVTGFTFENNIATYGQYGLFSTVFGIGETALQGAKGAVTFKNVVLIGPQKPGYPNAVFKSDLSSGLSTGKGITPASLYQALQGIDIP
ncbi:MAG: Ig-like domain-containing protein [Gemmatimonadota bacterium]